MSDVKIIEAVLFAAGRPVSVKRLSELGNISEKKVLAALNIIQEKYNTPDSTFELVQLGTDWKLTVKKEYVSIVEKIAPDTELSKQVIETLAILAWKAPVLQSDIVKIRSLAAYDHISELKDKGLIAREKMGRSFVLKLTPKFFEYFDLEGKEDIEKMFAQYEQEAVDKQKVLEEKERKEEEERQKRQAEIDAAQGGPTVEEIKEQERSNQKDFLEQIEGRLEQSSERANKLVQEVKEFVSHEEPNDSQSEPEEKPQQ